MARIDKLKEEAIDLRTLKFFVLSIIIMLFAGFGTLYIKLISSKSPLIVIGMIAIMMFAYICVIIYHKYNKTYQAKLEELSRAKHEE